MEASAIGGQLPHLSVFRALGAHHLFLGRAAAVAVLVVSIAVLLSVLVRTSSALLAGVGDYDAYYSAALAVRSGESPYERALMWSREGWADSYPARPIDTPPYPYPPAFAIAFLPFTFVPVQVGALVWLALMVGCIVGTATVLTGLLLHVGWLYRAAAILGLSAIIALFQPVRASLRAAQVDCLLLFLLAVALWAFIKRSDVRAGMFLALAVSVKPFLGFLILFFLWKRAYRAAALVAAISGLLLVLPIAILGPQLLSDLLVVWGHFSGQEFASDPLNQSLYGLALRLFSTNPYTVPIIDAPALAIAVRLAVSAFAIAAVVRLVSRSRTKPAPYLALEYGIVIVSMLLAGPLAQDNHYTYLVIPIVAAAWFLDIPSTAPFIYRAGIGPGPPLPVPLPPDAAYHLFRVLRALRGAAHGIDSVADGRACLRPARRCRRDVRDPFPGEG